MLFTDHENECIWLKKGFIKQPALYKTEGWKRLTALSMFVASVLSQDA